MKKLLASFLIIFLFSTNIVFSEQKIAFIDMDKVISTSNAGSSILKQLTDLNKKLDIINKTIENSDKNNIKNHKDLKVEVGNLKNDFDIMSSQNLKPTDFRLKVRNHHGLLAVTSVSKLYHSTNIQISFSGSNKTGDHRAHQPRK